MTFNKQRGDCPSGFLKRMDRHRSDKQRTIQHEREAEQNAAAKYSAYCLSSDEDKLRDRELKRNQKLTKFM